MLRRQEKYAAKCAARRQKEYEKEERIRLLGGSEKARLFARTERQMMADG